MCKEIVCILMSTFNGAEYLKEQIQSILNQKDVFVKLVIRDDMSSDNTVEILNLFRMEFPDIIDVIQDGGNLGPGQSFLRLLKYAVNKYSEINYFGFADQDDVWMEEKCVRGISKIKDCSKTRTLYFSSKKIVNKYLTEIEQDKINYHNDVSDYFYRSNVSGCTMIFTREFGEMIVSARLDDVQCLHDAFLYRTAIATDSNLIFDNYAGILYRQHEGNAVGSVNERLVDKISKLEKLFSKRKYYLKNISRQIYTKYSSYMDYPTNKIVKSTMMYNDSFVNKCRFTLVILSLSKIRTIDKVYIILNGIVELI